jgi:RNA polymerase sigma-70 factor, ECF subfamily
VTDEFRTRMVGFLPRFRRFAVALTGDIDEADDLVQEACVRALTRREQWQPGTRLDSWMYRIVQNVWLDCLRAKKIRGEQVDVDTAPAIMGSDGRQVVETRLTLNTVSAALAHLPDEQRILIALVCIDGLTYKEAAEITATPIGTVMSRLARARRELHARLEGLGTSMDNRQCLEPEHESDPKRLKRSDGLCIHDKPMRRVPS